MAALRYLDEGLVADNLCALTSRKLVQTIYNESSVIKAFTAAQCGQ